MVLVPDWVSSEVPAVLTDCHCSACLLTHLTYIGSTVRKLTCDHAIYAGHQNGLDAL